MLFFLQFDKADTLLKTLFNYTAVLCCKGWENYKIMKPLL